MEGERELAKLVGSTLAAVRVVSPEEYMAYSSHHDVLVEFSNDFDIFRMVSDAYGEFNENLKGVVEEVAGAAALNQSQFDPLVYDSARLMLNFLGAVRTFLDHTQTRITRKYGSDSGELQYYKEITGHQFDNFFSYRLLYKMRNFVQHCGLPPVSISLVNNVGVDVNLELLMDPLLLLDAYDSWGLVVTKDLREFEGKISLHEILEEHFDSVFDIYIDLYSSHQAEEVRAGVEWFTDFLQDPSPSDNYCFVSFPPEMENNPKSMQFRVEWIPTQMLRKAEWTERQIYSGDSSPEMSG